MLRPPRSHVKEVVKTRRFTHESGTEQPVLPVLPKGFIQALQQVIKGRIIVPGDKGGKGEKGYDQARQIYNVAIQDFPYVIVMCQSEQDVAHCLRISQQYAVPFSVRSGGHSFPGYCIKNGAVLIDVSQLHTIQMDLAAKTVTVGAGVQFERLEKKIETHGLHVPTGSCPGVSVSGYMMGGGYGFTSREFGMNCDKVIRVKVLLANGQIVIADKDQSPDLYWAICGGTGGNFGILLEITYQLVELGNLWGFVIRFPQQSVAEALFELQQHYTRSGALPQLSWQGATFHPQGDNDLYIPGMYNGDNKAGKNAIASLLTIPGATLIYQKTGPYSELNEQVMDCMYRDIYKNESMPSPRVPQKVLAGYISRPLTLGEWQQVQDKFLDPANKTMRFIGIESYGGAINQTSPDTNAFVHRKADMDLFVSVFWMTEQQRQNAFAFLQEFGQWMLAQKFHDGTVYQNYPNPDLEDFQTAYWGAVFPKLLGIKQKYDPDNVFVFPQSIRPIGQIPTSGKSETETILTSPEPASPDHPANRASWLIRLWKWIISLFT